MPPLKGPASLILEPNRDIVRDTVNSHWNPHLLFKYLASDGVSTLTKEAEIVMSPLGWTAMIDLTDFVGGTAGGSGWKFPTAIKYNSSLTYSKLDVVYVDVANSALGQTQAWPGLWVATQDVPVPSVEKHYPNVQYNPDSDGKITNWDSTNNYWMPVGLNNFQFRISTLSNGDYYKAKLWDGTTLSSVEFTIAKPHRLRPSTASEVIDGATVSYSSYTSDNTRTASDGTNTEFQVAFPRFVAGSVNLATINAGLVLNGSGVIVSGKMIFMQENNPSRVWARRYVQ